MRKIILRLSKNELSEIIPIVQIMYSSNLPLFSESNYFHFINFRDFIKKLLDKNYGAHGQPLKRLPMRITINEYESFIFFWNNTASRLERNDLIYQRIIIEEMRSQLAPQITCNIAIFRSENFSYFRLNG